MKRKLFPRAVIILLSILSIDAAQGQEISDALRLSTQGLYFNARALGMGNAYSTIGYDFSALHFNPASMSVTGRASFTMSLDINAFKSSSDYYNTNIDFTTQNTSGSQAGLTIPFHLDSVRSFVVGAGFTQTKDFNLGYKYQGLNGGSPSFIQFLTSRNDQTARDLGLSYPVYDSSGNFAGDATILGPGLYENGYLLADGGMYAVPFGVSVQSVRNIFFGVSGIYNTGRYTSDLELSAQDQNDAYPDGVETVPGDPQTAGFIGTDYRIVRSKLYTGWDIRFGILYKLENFIGLSASFKMPMSHQVEEEVYVEGSTQFASNRSRAVPQTKSTSTYSLQPPNELTIGAMMNLWILTGTLEASYVDYSEMKLTGGADLPARTELNKRIKDDLGAVVNLNGGAEFRLPFTGLSGRAGFIYQPSPFGDDPPRFAQKYLTLGFGINSADMMQFDLAYAYGWRGEHKSEDTLDESGSQRTIGYHAVLVTMRFSP